MAGIDTAMLWGKIERRQEKRVNTIAMMPQHRALSARERRFLDMLLIGFQREADMPQGYGFGETLYLNAWDVLSNDLRCGTLPVVPRFPSTR